MDTITPKVLSLDTSVLDETLASFDSRLSALESDAKAVYTEAPPEAVSPAALSLVPSPDEAPVPVEASEPVEQPIGEPMDRQPLNAVTQADIDAELAEAATSDAPATVPED